MKKRKVDPWFPFWIDKWLHGSTVIELEPDERGIFVSLMALSKKDDGWVRANEGVPYLETQLCGLFNCKPELLRRTIKRCIAVGKIRIEDDGTFYMTSHENYKLSPRHQRRVESEMADNGAVKAEKKDIEAEKGDAISISKLNKNKSKLNNNNKKIEFDFEIPAFLYITAKDIGLWEKAYPACDISTELHKMADWLVSNPEKRKKNYRRFITNWLSRTQEKGGSKFNKTDKRKKEVDDWIKEPVKKE